jgi:hypothetical protein
MIDKILLKFFGWIDMLSDGISDLVIEKPKRKKRKCQKCHHKCHCKDELHADEYGLCTCDNCKCGA